MNKDTVKYFTNKWRVLGAQQLVELHSERDRLSDDAAAALDAIILERGINPQEYAVAAHTKPESTTYSNPATATSAASAPRFVRIPDPNPDPPKPQITKARRKTIEIVTLVLGAIAALLALRGCFVAKGDYHNPSSPALTFVGDVTQKNGITAIQGIFALQLKYQPMDGRRAFVEILTDEQYNIKKEESYVGGWGQHQGYWGGTILDASFQEGHAIVNVAGRVVDESTDKKYWIRAAVFQKNTYGWYPNQFEQLLYSLVGGPIDYKDGFYFVNEGGQRRTYSASRYQPFWILASEKGTAPPTVGRINSVNATVKYENADVSFQYPISWKSVKGKVLEEAITQLTTELRTVNRTLVSLDLYTSSDNELAFIVSRIRTTNALSAEEIILERNGVHADAKRAGDVTRVNKLERVTINDLQGVVEDLERSNGGRGHTVKLLNGRLIVELSLVVNEKSRYEKYIAEYERILATVRWHATTESTTRMDRCRGSYEPQKCEDLERKIASETPEERTKRQQTLETQRRAAMQKVR